MGDLLQAGLSFAALGLGILFISMSIQTCADVEAKHPGTLTDQKSQVTK